MQSLMYSLPFQTLGELLSKHSIDPEDDVSWTLTLGPGPEFLSHLEEEELKINVETRHAQIAKRVNLKQKLKRKRQFREDGWSIYGVALSQPLEGDLSNGTGSNGLRLMTPHY